MISLVHYYTLQQLIQKQHLNPHKLKPIFITGELNFPRVLIQQGLLSEGLWNAFEERVQKLLAAQTQQTSISSQKKNPPLYCSRCKIGFVLDRIPKALNCLFCSSPLRWMEGPPKRETEELPSDQPKKARGDGLTRITRVTSPTDTHIFSPASDSDSVPASDLFIMGKYKVIGKLGEGGMGTVYKAMDQSLNRLVALKLLHAVGGMSEEVLLRFQRESQMIARLNHPHIVPLYDGGEIDGKPFYAMEYMEGKDLRKEVKERGALSEKEALEWMIPIAGAVLAAHEAGVIHRDIKPENIMLDGEGKPYLMDFGLAKELGDDQTHLTRTGVIVGSPEFMAPEQAYGEKAVGPGADIYALGGVLYFLVSARPVFEGGEILALLRAVTQDPPIPIRRLNPEVSQDLSVVIHKCLEKAPEDRYPHIGALYYDLKALRAGNPIWAKPLSVREKGQRWLKSHAKGVITLVAVVVILLSVVGTMEYQKREGLREKAKKAAEKTAKKVEDLFKKSREKRSHLLTDRALEKKYPRLYKGFGDEKPGARREREKALRGWLQVKNMLEKALELAPERRILGQDLFDVERQIGILSLLGRNYFLAQVFFERCKKWNPSEGNRLLTLLNQRKGARAKQYLQKVREIMSLLKKAPPSGAMDEYVIEIVKMNKTYVVQKLLEVFGRKKTTLWQRLVVIRSLGQLGDNTISVHGFNSSTCLRRRLSQMNRRKSKWNTQEASELIWALGRLRDRRATYLVGKIRESQGVYSAFWKETFLPYSWLSPKDPKGRHRFSAEGWFREGKALLNQAKYSESIQAFTEAILINPKFVEAYLNRAQNYTRIKKYKKALEDFHQAILLKPRFAVSYGNRAVVYLKLNRPKKAMEDLTKAIKIRPWYSLAYVNRGLIYFNEKNYPKAIGDFTRAIKLNPKLTPVYINRALGYFQMKKYREAIDDFTRGLRLNPKYPMAYSERGKVYFAIKNYKKALEDYSMALRVNPQYADAYLNRGRLYQCLKRHRRAAVDFQRYLRLVPQASERDNLTVYILKYGED